MKANAMKHTLPLLFALLLAPLAALHAADAVAAKKPNIIFILTDDKYKYEPQTIEFHSIILRIMPFLG
jgi:hypothetical protein